MSDERYLTVVEAAARLRCNPETVKRMLHDGRLSGYRPGGRRLGWRIPASAVEALLSGKRR